MKNKQIDKTLTGKTGKDLLNLIDAKAKRSEKLNIRSPQGDTEIALFNFCESLLGHNSFGVTDDFFQIGGNSIKAIQLLSRISSHFLVQLEATDIFLQPTIAQLATLIQVKKSEQTDNQILTSIEKQERPELIPLSFSQERLLFVDLLEGSLQYHLPAVVRLKGNLNTNALAFALQQIINRHEVLRTVFLDKDGITYQNIKEKDGSHLGIVDGSIFKEDQEGLKKHIQQFINAPFDLSKDDMLRADLIRLDDEDNLLVFTMHHIASDGWSMSVFVKEVTELYNSYAENRPSQLPQLNVQYADYAIWQRNYMQGEVLEKKIVYWKEELAGLTPLQLPTDYTRPVVQSIRGAVTKFTLKKELCEKLNLLAKQYGATQFMTLLSIFNVLLYRYSNHNDICVGTPVAGRQHEELEGLIGFFVNTLVLRNEVNGNQTFIDLLQQIRTNTLRSFEHQDVPFEKVVKSVVREREMSRNPLCKVMFVFQNTSEIESLSIQDVEIIREADVLDTSKFDLTFIFEESTYGLEGKVEYSTDLYKQETILRMIDHFKELLNAIIENPDQSIGTLSMLTKSEKQQLLSEFNNTVADYPKDKSIVELFEEQVRKTPDNIALVFEDQRLTYKELNERSNQLAHYLLSKGLKEETLVPICVERGINLLVGIIGILKAGCAYVPIDPEYPKERIGFMLNDIKSSVIISSKEYLSELPSLEAFYIVEIDEEWSTIYEQPSGNPETQINPENLSYVIYTSGSTGLPKGVMITHGNVVSLVKGIEYVSLSSDDILLSTGSSSFDATTFEYWSMLLNGGQLILCKQDRLLDSELLREEIAIREVNKMWFTSSWFNELVDNDITIFEKLSAILVGGEKLSELHIEKLRQTYPEIDIINGYGPTENTTFSLTYKVVETDIRTTIPIGRPLNNRTACVLNNYQQLVPVGVAGEIYLGGAGLGKGYLNRPELTKEKFIKDPFNKKSGSGLYRTGDIGRWLPDGNIEYLGRMDEQVKIKGYRIELGEIESILQEYESVKNAVVIANEDKQGTKRLIGYVVSDGRFDREEIVSYLKSKLPLYMIPSQLVELESLPLTSNGKIDKKALPDINSSELISNEYVAPRNETEKILAEIWQDLLKIEFVGIHDNFFELGGDSIIIIQLISRARHAGLELQVPDIFSCQTIAKLVAVMEQKGSSSLTASGEQGLLTERCGLLPIQQWYFERPDVDISHFNQAVLLSIDKSVTPEALRSATEQLTAQHDALRFKYSKKDGQWTQEYGTNPGELITLDLQLSQEGSLVNLIKEHADNYQRSLDIEKGELVRFVLIQTPENQTHNRILIVIHHLAVDGVSWRILLDNLELLLTGIQKGEKTDLGHKSSSYRQWYEALEQYSLSKRLLSQISYWEQVVSNYESLPVDKASSDVIRAKDIETHTMHLDSVQTQLLLQEVPRVYHTEINDMLLCALSLTLCDWSSTEKVIIGLEGHGRESISESIDTSRTVGWFTSLYPVLLGLAHSRDIPDSIKSVKEQLRRVPDKGLGYGVLKYINKDEKLSGRDCWDIVFNYFGQLDNVVSRGRWLSEAGESNGTGSSEEQTQSHRISVNGMVQGSELILNWSYSCRHYEKETIVELAKKYQATLESLISHCIEQQKSGVVYTPSDYGLGSEVSYEELDIFLEEPYGGSRGIARRESVEGLYRLSGLQEGMLFHALYDSRAGAYIEQLSCDLRGPDPAIISKSWEHLLSRHSILRSGFYYDAFSVPVQCVYREVELPVTILDYRDMSTEEQDASLKEYEESDRLRGFDFKSAPLMRIGLIRLSEERYRMLWTSHHILFDGWSLPILIEEFLSTYELLISGKEVKTTEEDRYEDYIRYIERVPKDQQEIYWRGYMKGVEQRTLLPFIGTTTHRTKGVGAYESVSLKLDSETKSKAQHYAQRHRLTINTLIQGVWSYLLHSYTGSDDIVYGVTVSGRPDDLPGIEKRVGMYINTLPLHSAMQKKEGIVQWLQKLQKDQVSSRKYQYTPLQEIQGWTGINGDLFDSILVFENYPVSEVIGSKEWSLRVENIQIQEQTNYPLTIIVSRADKINIDFSYNAGILRREYVNEIRDHFENVFLQVISNEESSLGGIELLTKSEKNRLLVEFNDTADEYPQDKTIIDLFEEQVIRTPDNIALVFEDQRLTYKELNNRSNQLANYLIEKGIVSGENIGLLSLRSIEMVIGMFGILKSGCSYVPFNTEFPAERLNYIIEDTAITHIVTVGRELLNSSGLTGYEIIDVKDSSFSSSLSPGIKTGSDSCVYVMFTSGTTGRPKGIAVSHRNVIKLVFDNESISVRQEDRVLQWSNYSFDGSTYDIYSSLLKGASLYLIRDNWASDIDALSSVIREQNITICFMTTALFNSFIDIQPDAFKGLRKILFGGEMVSLSHVREALSIVGEGKITHVYGPTETTVYATSYPINKINEDGIIPIGKPLSNTKAFILNGYGNLVPVGIAGELYIGGEGVSLGYVKNPALSQEKFIPNSFSDNRAEKLYRTGDIVRWLPEGSIEYLGRMDEQVKIRGYRVEPGEIENVLLQCESVNQAVVVAREDKQGTKGLVGYIVSTDVFDKEAIRVYLSSRLPDYMIPALWVELESLPLTPNGKIDRKLLPEPDASKLLSNEYVVPRNDVEVKLATIWKELLGIDRVGIYDNFFELGGHSLLAMRVISLIRKELELEVAIRDLFLCPTIAELAVQLESQSRGLILPAIAVQPRPEHIPLSFSQERLWFIDRLEGSVQYHVPAVLRLQGKLNKDALIYALQNIVNRHEALRTVIREKGGVSYQHIKDSEGWELKIVDGTKFGGDDNWLQEYIKQLIALPFDLSKDYMMRGQLIRVGGEDHTLVVTIHHIASDGWSLSVIVKELVELYKAYEEDREAILEPLQIQYSDYAMWQRNYLQGEVLKKKLDYWKEKLENVELLQLPTDYKRPALQSFNGATNAFEIDKDLLNQLHDLGQQHGTTLFMTLLAAFKVLLYRYSGQQDICVGSPTAGRQQKEVEGLIGFFVNTLALRSEVSGDASFTELLEQVRLTTLEAYQYQEAPFEKVVEAVVSKRDMNRSPLFQVMFALQNTPDAPPLHLGEVILSMEDHERTTSQFDLTLSITETTFGLQCEVEYCTDLFAEKTVDRMMRHFQELLSSIVTDPQQKIGLLPMLTKTEEHQLSVEFNDTTVEYPKNKSVLDLFEEQVIKTPNNIALVFEDKQLTYKELNDRSNQLAHYLHSKGVKEETLVPICIERSMDMIIGILGILKAGGAYVPVDPEYPLDRISYMLEDTGSSIIVSNEESSTKLPTTGKITVISLDEDWPLISEQPTANISTNIQTHHLAYVIYTSGSTGKPKGVMIEHGSLMNRLSWAQDYFRLTSEDSVLQKTTFCFDVSVWELLWPLLAGSRLVFAKPEGEKDTRYLKSIIDEDQITMIHFVPSMLELFLAELEHEECAGLKKVLCSGEALKQSHVKLFTKKLPNAELHNLYGPTEAAIDVTYWSLNHSEEDVEVVPIGKPVSNTSIYILDDWNNLVPLGGIGQIHIGGIQVARGYLNMPELTNQKFAEDLFDIEPGSKIYKTGDLGRWLPDGNIQYLGRMDQQIKIRGYRIELGEIESVLQQSGFVRQSIVLAKEDSTGNKRLVGYIIPEGSYYKQQITTYLRSKLPEYMVPSVWIELEHFPLTPNGKIDKKALPDPDGSELIRSEYIAPRNETEEKFAAIWQQLLGLERVGIHDNFFELGGHSLLAMRLISSIRGELELELSIRDLFQHPTISELAVQNESQSKGLLLPAIAVQPRPEHIPLSFSQERLWFIDRLEGSVQYHIPAVLRFKGNLNKEALTHSMQSVIGRHEALRTVIREEEGKAYQLVKDKDSWKLQFIDGSQYNDNVKGLENYIQELINIPFDLSEDYMVRGHLISLNDHDHVLVITFHHISSDGWSTSIIVKELAEFYSSYEEGREANLEPLHLKYADYAIWQRRYLQGEVLDNKLGYWKKKLEGLEPLRLPTDYSRPAVHSTKGSAVEFSVDKELSEQLQLLSQQYGVTLFMTLLSVYKILLYRYSDQQDICVGIGIAGRQQQEIEKLIGFFVNTLALRSELNSDASFTELLQQVKVTTIEAYEHQEAPFEKVVDAMVGERDMSRNPLVQVMFVLQNTPEVPELRLRELSLSNEVLTHNISKFDLTLYIMETPLGLQGSVEYCTDLYSEQTIDRIIGHFKELLRSVVKDPQQTIGSLPMLTKSEKHQLLVEFNKTEVPYPKYRNIIDLFEKHVARNPEAVAIVFENEQFTYRELNEKSNQFAHYLQSKGVKKETLVPVCIERGMNMITGILGILKAGGAYVPIDPDYPLERIKYVLEDTGAKVIVTDKDSRSKLQTDDRYKVIELDADWGDISNNPTTQLQTSPEPHHLAYIIYTSGSSGMPKGVMIEHRGVVNLSLSQRDALRLKPEMIGLQFASIGFDASCYDIFNTLLSGGCLVLCKKEDILSSEGFEKLINKHSVEIGTFPPSFLNVVKDSLGTIKTVVSAGEALNEELGNYIQSKGIRLVNAYGPTETTVCATLTDNPFRGNNITSIGTPVSNLKVYILDKTFSLCPVGVMGEICVEGVQLARGYLNRPELTSEKFIKDPFSKKFGARLYRTGDFGRWLPDGNIEYLGRIDDQVKIRGYRIELGEIESVMNNLKMVSSSCVVINQDQAITNKLAAYYIPAQEEVKLRELDLYQKRIETWKELYETEYSEDEDISNQDSEFNITGWNDSFTGNQIPAEQMHKWLDDTVRVILSERPERVLEIGCGTGLIYYSLVGHIQKYTGIDFSQVSINQIINHISKADKEYPPTDLKVCLAHEVELDKNETVDTIILNSVVQYFPGEKYLSDVLAKSISILKGKGRIIVGDVRDNRLLKLFKSRLYLQQSKDSLNIPDFNWGVEQELSREEELCLSPEYFYNLRSQYPEITHIDIQWKQGDYVNELTLYRYTVIIYVGIEKELIQPDWQSWDKITNKESVIEKLNNGNTSIAIKNVPNPRLSKEILLEKGLKNKSVKTVRDLSDYIRETSKESIEINEIISAAIAKGYQCKLMVNENPLKINLLIEKNSLDGFVKQEYNYNIDASNSFKSNVPLLRDIYSLLKKDIQESLKEKLPDYMIPSELTALQYFPLTTSGKVDRNFLRKYEEKEGISNKYAAPRNEIEWVLAGIWQELLDLELVGIHDNFFELGGDSIITIQFLSRARRLGYELKPKDIFIHQTIGSLSAVVAERSAAVITGEQGILTGRSGLLPIQQWYLEGAGDAVSHFNQAVILSIDKSVTQEELGSATEQLTERHDALRFRYYKDDDQWNQEYGINNGVLITLDLKSAKKSSLANLIKEHADKYQRSLDIENGELVKFVLIQTPDNQIHNRILIVIHHLAVDGVSWRILLDDLELLLTGIRKGKKTELGHKSSSYRQWYNALESYSQSKRLLSQIHYWEKVADSYEPLFVDKEYAGIVKVKDVETFTINLDPVQTKMLLQDIPRVYHTEINDMLLCALALTLCEWSSKEKVVIGLEGHGRESISESIDTSHTVGWFTSLYPLLLELTPGRDISDSIKTVKEQLRRVPDKGLGYGVLKYINKSTNKGEKLFDRDCWDIVFNYLGQLDNVVSSGKLLSGAGESSGAGSNEEQKVSHLISVNSVVQGGELILNWSYSNLNYERKTIVELVKKYQATLESLISHCMEKQKSGSIYTPSDYGLGAEINYKELDRFLEKPYRGIVRKESVQGLYRLSGLQEGMLFHALYDSKAGIYIEQISCDLSGPDLEIFSKSWEHVLRNHSVLRSAFYYDEFSIPVQCVYRDVELPVTILDYRDMNQEEQKAAIKEYKESDCLRGFDFKSAPLMRIVLIRLSDDHYKMILSAHHILFDGWSNAILIEEFLNTYELLVSGKEIPYAEEDRFEDYIRYIEREDMDQQEMYWSNYMKGVDQSTLLPFIGTTTQRTKGAGDYESIYLNLDNETKVKAEQFAQRHRLTLNTIMQGVWSYLLHHYTGNNDVVYGIAVSGRPDNLPGIEKRVGMYVNTLPFHSSIQKDREIVQWLKDLQNNQISSLQYQLTPLHKIQRWTGVSGDLFDSLLVFENYPVNEIVKSKQWSLRAENFLVEELTNFPLTIMIGSSAEIIVRFSYNSEILKNEYVKKIRDHFKNVLLQITSNEVNSLGEINLLSKSEEHQLLVEFNNTAVEYPKNISIVNLFEEQAEKTPDCIALVFDDKNLTYKELNEKANQLAHYLKNKGVKAETLVPICMERGMDMIIGIIGILKAGGAYVPVDPDYPVERISFMLEDSGAEVMISSKDVRSKLSDTKNIKNIVTDIGKAKSEINKKPVHNLKDKVKPDNLTYLLYTSGSTGNPKGVRMPGSSLVNLLLWQDKQFVNKQRRVLQFTSLNFDVSFQEIFSTLCFGSTLCLISTDRRIDMSEVMKDIEKNKITHLFVPYIVLKNLAEFILSGTGDSYTLEEIITAGEQLKLTNDIDGLLEKGNIKLVNQYGPTEAHVVSSFRLDRSKDLPALPPIGKPVNNTQFYVVGDVGQLVPIGVPGELYIGGVQLARGYLNLPELTKEKFIQNPFVNKDSMVYRTGDLVRWLPDGNIEYLGRIDDQVKIRGYRVEPGEIESTIQESGLVNSSVVIAKEDKDGSKLLIGYVVAGETFDKDRMILYLKSRLPEYMLPAFWVELESIPLTPNGKTDKKALPDPDITKEQSNQYEAPRNEIEEKLAAIWKELLGLERIGVNDNFFELGGHSLLATRAVSAIEKEFSINIPVKALFDYTSISELRKYIKVVKSNKTKTKRIESEVFDL